MFSSIDASHHHEKTIGNNPPPPPQKNTKNQKQKTKQKLKKPNDNCPLFSVTHQLKRLLLKIYYKCLKYAITPSQRQSRFIVISLIFMLINQ